MQFDYIIVGAGSAGCVLANRLTENVSDNVLLLEAGAKPNMMINIPGAYSTLHRTKVDWGFWTEPQKHVRDRQLYVPRGKVVGGCSSTNAMAYVRGNAKDYDHWEGLGNNGWSYKDVLPYFKRSEHHEEFNDDYHGLNGELNVSFSKHPHPLTQVFLKACAEKGIAFNKDYNGSQQMGASLLQFTIKNNKRHSASEAFLKPILYRKNLTVRTKVYARKIIIENGKATGVELVTDNKTTETIHCTKEVILSAGVIQSPKILLHSGIGDAALLNSIGIDIKLNLKGVGKNLQDHIWAPATSLCNIKTANNAIKPANMIRELLNYLLFKKGPFCNSPIEANAFIKTDASLTTPDIQFHFAPIHIGNDYNHDLYDIKTIPTTNGFAIMNILLHPESRGFVSIKNNDPFDAPVIQPNFLSKDKDLLVLLKGLKKAIEVMSAMSFKSFSPGGINFPLNATNDEELTDHIKKSLETLYHPVGTCKMGMDEMAVVNERLQVHGVKNLRVIDASIMPEIISGNTNAPTMMIAEKGADMIKIKGKEGRV